MALMKYLGRRLLATTLLATALSGITGFAADTANTQTNRDARSVIVQMRLRRLTQDLNLTAAQQAQFKALLDNETSRIAEFQTNQDLTLTERFKKQTVVHEDIRDKMRLVLSDEQRPKWDAAIAKTKSRKAKSADKSAAALKTEKKDGGEVPKAQDNKATDTAPADKPGEKAK